MKYLKIPVTPFQQNCSLIWCEATQECVLVDPGGDVPKLIAAIEKEGVKPIAVWLTHGHLDHVGGTMPIAEHYQIPVIGPHEADAYWLDGLPIQSRQFGFPPHEAFRPTQWLKQGDTLTVGKESFAVLHTPGHTPVMWFYLISRQLLCLWGMYCSRAAWGVLIFRGETINS